MESAERDVVNMEPAERGVVNTERGEVNMESAERAVLNLESAKTGVVRDSSSHEDATPRITQRDIVSRNIDELVSSIYTLGDQCAILYLDEHNNKVQHYGTTAGKKFLAKQQDITLQFLAFCYNGEVVQCTSDDTHTETCDDDRGDELPQKSPQKRKAQGQVVHKEKKRRLSNKAGVMEDIIHSKEADDNTAGLSSEPRVCLERLDDTKLLDTRKKVIKSEATANDVCGTPERRVLGRRSSAIKFKEMMLSLGKRNRKTSPQADGGETLQGASPEKKRVGRPVKSGDELGSRKKGQGRHSKKTPVKAVKEKSSKAEISHGSQKNKKTEGRNKENRKDNVVTKNMIKSEKEEDFVMVEYDETEEIEDDLKDETWRDDSENERRKSRQGKPGLGVKKSSKNTGKITVKLESPDYEENEKESEEEDEDVEPKCLECEKEFKSLAGLHRHLKSSGHEQVSMVETDYRCYTCYKYYQRMCDLVRHMEETSHTGIEERLLERKMETINHIKENRKSAAMYRCSLCRADYKHAENCMEHVSKGTCSPKYRKKCPCCPMAFNSRNFLHVHLKKKHRQEYPFKCAHCAKVFHNLRSLQNHSQMHRKKSEENADERESIDGVDEDTNTLDESSAVDGAEKYASSASFTKGLQSENESPSTEDITEEKMDPELRLKLIMKMQHQLRGIAGDQDTTISDELDSEQTCSVCSEKFINYTQLKVHIVSSGHEQIVEEETGYKCFTCDKYFVKLVDLEGHMETTSHAGNPVGKMRREAVRIQRKAVRKYGKDFKCSYCTGEFSTLEQCQEHIDKATCDKRYRKKCECCNLFFTQKNLYHAHMFQKHQSEFPFKCDKCDEEFEVVTCFLSHLRTHKAGSEHGMGAYKCDQCDKRFQKKFRLLTHVQKEHRDIHSPRVKSVIDAIGKTQETDYKCFTCNLFYQNMASLEEHMRITGHTGNPEYTEEIRLVPTLVKPPEAQSKKFKPVRCSKCHSRFPSVITGQRHVAKGNCKVHWRKLCPCCSKIFNKKNLFEGHMKELHKDEYPFKCEDCEKIFYRASAFSSHRVNTHNRAPFRMFPEGAIKVKTCPVCSKSFRGQGNYNQHMRSAHTGVKPFICEQCGLKFSRPHYLKEHVQAQHERDPNDPNLECQYCSKVFKTVKTKLMHERMMHLRGKEHTCDICGYQARKLGTLNYHIAQKHTSEPAYTCHECGDKFKVKPNFHLHMANHALQIGDIATAETYCKIHKCTVCDQAFAQSSRLDQHMLKHMGAQALVSCKICGQRVACSTAGLRNHYRRRHKLAPQAIKDMVSRELTPKELLAKVKENIGDTEVPVQDVPYESRLSGKRAKKKSRRLIEGESDNEIKEEITQYEEVYEELVAIPLPTEKPHTKPKVQTELRDYLEEAASQIAILESSEEPSTSLPEDVKEVIVQMNSEHSQAQPTYIDGGGGRIHLIIPDGGGQVILQDHMGNVIEHDVLSTRRENGVFIVGVQK